MKKQIIEFYKAHLLIFKIFFVTIGLAIISFFAFFSIDSSDSALYFMPRFITSEKYWFYRFTLADGFQLVDYQENVVAEGLELPEGVEPSRLPNYPKEDLSDVKIGEKEFWSFKLRSSASETNPEAKTYWQDWKFNDKIVIANVENLSRTDGTLTFKLVYPKEINSKTTIETKVMCNKGNTFLLAKDGLDIKKSEVDFFQEAKFNSPLYFYCNDINCSSIGNKFCAILE